MYSPARRSPLNRGLIQHQYYADSVCCEARYERIVVEITHGRRHFIILVVCIANSNPEHDEYPSEANKARGNATRSHPYPPQSCNERVESKYLTRHAPICFKVGEDDNRGGDAQE
jgi:hypothetical protein